MKRILIAAVLLTLAGVGGYALFQAGLQRGQSMSAAPAPAAAPAPMADAGPMSIAQGEEATRRHIAAGIKAGDVDPANGKKVLYYHDPMVPGNRFDQPAKSPFMDMMLVPVYADGGGGGDTSQVTVSARTQQNLGVRTAEVVAGSLAPRVEAVGNIAFNERDQAVLQSRARAFVERVHVRATLEPVRAGQVLAELYVPEWVAAQEELLALQRMPGADLEPLRDAARQRMRQLGMDDAQVDAVAGSGRIQRGFAVRAPMAGVLTEIALREGMTVMAGATLFRINGLGTVWADAEVPESQSAALRPGMKVVATSPALPDQRFDGRVQAILPEVDTRTRTLKVRLELANPGARLVPGMFVQMVFSAPGAAKSLLVPSEAIIQTGQRTLVMLAEDGGRFRPVPVRTGRDSDGQTEVLDGLKAGQRVVVSSQFLIDSEASLRGIEARLNAAPTADGPRYRTEARVEDIDRDTLLLWHPPIAELKWGEMTMGFKPPADGLPKDLAVGDRVQIEFSMGTTGEPQITSLQRLAPPGAKR